MPDGSGRGSHSAASADDVVARLRAAGCVFAEDEARLLVSEAGSPQDLAAMVDQRVAGLPLEHILGWVEFCGLRIEVDPGVFVPRRRTQFLVAHAVELIREMRRREDVEPQARATVIDVCCGCGALGAALSAAVDGVQLYAVDVDPAAVKCARRNLGSAGGQVFEGNFFQPLPAPLRGRVDVLVANIPYVPSGEIALLPPEARLYESLVALDGGADGLDLLRRLTAAAPPWLSVGGHLLIETSEHQVPKAMKALADHGLTARVVSDDDSGATVVTGTKPVLRRHPRRGT